MIEADFHRPAASELLYRMEDDAVTCAFPGAKNRAEAKENAGASKFPPLGRQYMAQFRALYESRIRAQVL